MTVVFYKDRKREWRWQVRGRTGRVLADSGEGYRRAVDCKKALWAILNAEKLGIEGYPFRKAS